MKNDASEYFVILDAFAVSCERLNEYSRHLRDTIPAMKGEVRTGVDVRKYNDGARFEKWIEIWGGEGLKTMINCWWFEIGLEQSHKLFAYASFTNSDGDLVAEHGPTVIDDLDNAEAGMRSAVDWLISFFPCGERP